MRTRLTEVSAGKGLFSDLPERSPRQCVRPAVQNAVATPANDGDNLFEPWLEILDRASDIDSAQEIFQLILGQSDSAIGDQATDPAVLWRRSSVRRETSIADVGQVRALPGALKRLFDYYFRDDLYGRWIKNDPIVLSSGSFDERVFGMSAALKSCVDFALSNNWYGYSDSRGREQTREALAALECRSNPREIAITLGATATISSIGHLVARNYRGSSPRAVCAVPNYVPLVAAIAHHFPTDLVPTPLDGRALELGALTDRVREGAALVLLQSVNNPWGVGVRPDQLRRLVDEAPADCVVVVDECHKHFGPAMPGPADSLPLTGAKGATVIRVQSLSKQWAAPGIKCGWIQAPERFIDAFYCHASTTYGGPPSIFALLLEVYARFEAFRREGVSDSAGLGRHFTREYGLSADTLQRGFDHYIADQADFDARVRANRQIACERLTAAGIETVAPDYSINVLCRHGRLPDFANYRELLREFNVAVFPGTLCMLPGPGVFRISPCLETSVLEEGLQRLEAWAAAAN